MYELVTLRDKIRVEAKELDKEPREAIVERIQKDYIGKIAEDKMLFIGFVGVDSVEEGTIIPGDASVYYDTVFKLLAYIPTLHETIRGQVSGISEIGALINIGPMDGLAHISQTMDDFVDFSKNALIGRKTKISLKTGDNVIANVTAISTKGIMKVGLTMRMPGLGKLGAKKKEVKQKK